MTQVICYTKPFFRREDQVKRIRAAFGPMTEPGLCTWLVFQVTVKLRLPDPDAKRTDNNGNWIDEPMNSTSGNVDITGLGSSGISGTYAAGFSANGAACGSVSGSFDVLF